LEDVQEVPTKTSPVMLKLQISNALEIDKFKNVISKTILQSVNNIIKWKLGVKANQAKNL
jgi:hypothetical protein